jgi:hypothetical protein
MDMLTVGGRRTGITSRELLMIGRLVQALTVLLLIGSLGCALPRNVTTATLLEEMTDLKRIPEYPEPRFTCRQFSSYDRASTSIEDQDTWFANYDRGHFLRSEERSGRTEHVMMDAAGPGAIVRIWSANPMGTLRIYLDHEPQPVIEATMSDLLGGDTPGLPKPLAGERSKGWNLYFPIPYAEHCLVTCDEDNFYYHVNYRTYEPGTRVRSFSDADLVEFADKVLSTAKLLTAPRHVTKESAGTPKTYEFELPPGQSFVPWQVSKARSGAIVSLQCRVDASDLDRQALRHVLLSLGFDGERTVLCPLGEFFGAAPGLNEYESLPLGVAVSDVGVGDMWCHWRMPYEHSAQLALHNYGAEPVRLVLEVRTEPQRWTDRSMHFCAQWRGAQNVPSRPPQDWNYVDIQGQGVFVGAAFFIANPTKIWWGEGDEKIYVDGEDFPSHFGTGTEDYYGYAWCWPEVFTHAYHNQPRVDGPGNWGHTAVNRWHIIDRIPFERNFRFDMELWHWRDVNVDMSVVTYWYARPGATSNRPTIQPEDLKLEIMPSYEPMRVAGAIEGEEMQVVEKRGIIEAQAIEGCSNDTHLWWRGAQPQDTLVVAFPVDTAGRFRVHGRFVNAIDYGIVQLYLNDKALGGPIDMFHTRVIAADERLLGELDLAAGGQRLIVQIVGCNDQAKKGYMFGLDYLRLERVE